MKNLKIAAVLTAAALTASLAACGAAPDSQARLVQDAVKAMEDGNYDALVELCSPATRLEAASSVVLAKMFDPSGTFLRAAAADLKADFADNGAIDNDATSSAPVQVGGRWFIDCSE